MTINRWRVASFTAMLVMFMAVLTAQAQTATGEARLQLGRTSALQLPAGADFTGVEIRSYTNGPGVAVVYEYDASVTTTSTRVIVTDLCSQLNGVKLPAGWHKSRIDRLQVTDAFWDLTNRIELGTFTVCSFEYIIPILQ